MLDDVAREEVALDERAERSADAVLSRRHDRRVRNRNAERMTEQRCDGKPVGEPTDHGRFHRRAHDAEPREPGLEHASDGEQYGCGNEKERRTALHRIELRLTRRLVVHDLHGPRADRTHWRGGWSWNRTAGSSRLGHRGVTLTLAKSTMSRLAPSGTSTYSTTGRP